MSNPWLKKNPFMSMWLSAANRLAGFLSRQAPAQAKRPLNEAVSEVTRQILKIWSDGANPITANNRRRR